MAEIAARPARRWGGLTFYRLHACLWWFSLIAAIGTLGFLPMKGDSFLGYLDIFLIGLHGWNGSRSGYEMAILKHEDQVAQERKAKKSAYRRARKGRRKLREKMQSQSWRREMLEQIRKNVEKSDALQEG